jgi:aryl-alcohol dehydrogenase-like predicted oxidoreductase
MFAVRRALTNPARLREVLEELGGSAALGAELEAEHPLGFLRDVRDAAYRFCANEPGADVVLTGTGNVQHLEENIESLLSGPLPTEQMQRLDRLFGGVDSVSGH